MRSVGNHAVICLHHFLGQEQMLNKVSVPLGKPLKHLAAGISLNHRVLFGFPGPLNNAVPELYLPSCKAVCPTQHFLAKELDNVMKQSKQRCKRLLVTHSGGWKQVPDPICISFIVMNSPF